jgi:hypothetical protein
MGTGETARRGTVKQVTCASRDKRHAQRPYIHPVVLLDNKLCVHVLYDGYCFWGGPTQDELVSDLREVIRSLRADWNPPTR